MIGINSIGSNPIGIYIDLYQISTTGFSNTNSFGNSYAFSSGGLYMYLRGTTQSIFQIGKSGPNIKNNSNVVEIRNSADSGYNDIKSAGVLLSNGTSSAPAIRFSDDTDTGIYSSSSNTISFSTGGIVAAKIDTIADGTNYLTFVPGTSSTKPLITNNGSITSGEEALGIEIRSGSAASAGKGGTILLAAGDSTDGAGGDVYLRAGGGSETGNDGGTVYIDSGSADVSSDYGGIQLRIVTTPALTISNTLNSSFAGTVTGVGSLIVNGTSASGADIKLYEDTDNGTNYVAFKAPASISTDVTWTLPNADGSENQVLSTNGSGTLSWSTISGGATLSNDTTTNATYYPTLSSTTTGTYSTAYVSSTKFYFNPSTGRVSSTEFQTLSDSTKKENITNIDNALGIINNVNGVRFNWIDTKEPSLGLIAQEIEKYLPEIVDSSSSDTKTINYNGMIGVLVEAIKDLTSQLNDLKDQVKCLAS